MGACMGVTIDSSNSFRVAFNATGSIAAEEPSEYAFLITCALACAPIMGKQIAWIGGGFCIGPRLFIGAKSTVFEIEPDLREFCPEGVEFVAGDWRDTISGKFDIVIFHLGGDVPYFVLEKHLNPGGVILPKKEA